MVKVNYSKLREFPIEDVVLNYRPNGTVINSKPSKSSSDESLKTMDELRSATRKRKQKQKAAWTKKVASAMDNNGVYKLKPNGKPDTRTFRINTGKHLAKVLMYEYIWPERRMHFIDDLNILEDCLVCLKHYNEVNFRVVRAVKNRIEELKEEK